MRALKFKQERGRLPSITSPDAWEKRMAEGAAAFLARFKDGGARAKFTEEDDALSTSLASRSRSRRRRASRSPREERIIAGFEEIQRFVEKHGRAPQHGEDRDIFERLYAVRLDRLRELDECRALLEPLDHQGLLAGAEPAAGRRRRRRSTMTSFWPQLGGRSRRGRHHRTSSRPHQRRQARGRGNRQSPEVRGLRPLQAAVRAGAEGTRRAASGRPGPFELKAEIRPGSWFIVGGQKAYVAEMGEVFTNAQGRTRRAAARDLRQRHREQPAHALACSARSTRTKPGGGSPIPSPVRCSPMKLPKATRQAARSMFCAASRTIRLSRPTATFCTRSA